MRFACASEGDSAPPPSRLQRQPPLLCGQTEKLRHQAPPAGHSGGPRKATAIRRSSITALLGVLVLLTLAEPSHGDWLMDCGDCHCKWNSGKKTADCKNLSLASVPENLSSEVQVLDLSFNRIAYLEQNAFLNAQLHNLHKLYIRNSSLQQIDPRTFTQLEILIELDLSNNLLRALQANLFVRLVKVRALVLNGNLLEFLGDGIFQNLKYLHKVELKDNRLTRIAPRAFENVPLLTQIYLNGNRFGYLRKESFESLKRLTALSLDGNPWNCTCELQIFRDFVLKRNLYTPPTACYHPVKLRGMLWVEDQPEAFACKPRIIYPARGASINTSKENVTLICRVHASPNTIIAWDYNKQMYRANGGVVAATPQHQRVHIQLLRDEQSKEKEFGRDVFISRLTITGAEKSDEGVYTCIAENAGGKDAVQMSLLVQKPGARELLLQGNLLIVISLMALGLLSISVFLAMVTCCIYKRFKSESTASLHRHHHNHNHHQLDQDGNQLTTTTTTTTASASNPHAITTSLAGADVDGLDVVGSRGGVGGGGEHDKSKMNGDPAGPGGEGKYAELRLKGGGLGVGATITAGGCSPDGMTLVDRAYLERNTEDKLHIKFPHGTMSSAEIISNRHSPASMTPSKVAANSAASTGGYNNNNQSHTLGPAKRYADEFQPDLLPAAHADHRKMTPDRDRDLYSPLKPKMAAPPLKTSAVDEVKHSLYATLSSSPNKPNSNIYNSAVQEYLQTKSCVKAPLPDVGLTASSSLSESTMQSSLVAAINLQRHSKSLAMPHRGNAAAISSANTPPTDSLAAKTAYEYRQPPPPPYNANHRTTSGAGTLLTRRTSTHDEESVGMGVGIAWKDYRDDLPSQQQQPQLQPPRETIVTASPSLNFLTTTGTTAFGVPQRQLL